MRSALKDLDRQHFDAVVVGAGVNGASTAQHLSAAGYSILLLDKEDFGSGASSRSSRLLHCGLRYLAPGRSAMEFVRHPDRFAVACRMARQAMQSRAQFVAATPQRVRALKFAYPIYNDGPYRAWHVDVAFRLLATLGSNDVPLDYRRLSPAKVTGIPLLRHLRAPERLRGVAMFREYQFDWPERVVVDTVLDAERLGAVIRNYTPVVGMHHDGHHWFLTISDADGSDADTAEVSAKLLFNMAGTWIDQVNSLSGAGVGRKITGTKGVHIAVRLNPDCQDYGVATINRLHEPFYCVPWRGLHYIGPTETLYEGDLDDIRPTEDEIASLVEEANWLLPGLALQRSHVLYAWAGVRPLTYDPAQPMGARSRKLHDLSSEGMPNAFAMTAGPVMTHRSAGAEAVAAAARRFRPSSVPKAPSYASVDLPRDPDSPALVNHDDRVRLADLRHAVEAEHARTLHDVMFRRTGLGWSETMGREAAHRAAEELADVLGWDWDRTQEEAAAYINYLVNYHTIDIPRDVDHPEQIGCRRTS